MPASTSCSTLAMARGMFWGMFVVSSEGASGHEEWAYEGPEIVPRVAERLTAVPLRFN